MFLHSVGEAARQVYNTPTFDEEGDNMKYDKILEKLEAYVNPRKNVTFCRYQFFTYRQEEGQSFDKYLIEMRNMSNNCEFDILKNSLLTDMLIIGLKNKNIQERLLREDNLTLDKVIKNCKTAELTSQQAKLIQKGVTSTDSINTVDYVRKFKKPYGSYGPKYTKPQYIPQKIKNKQNEKKAKIQNCKFCSYSHDRGSCPAFPVTCNSCGKKGHYSKCYQNRKDISHITTNTNLSEADSDLSETENIFCGAISVDNEENENASVEEIWEMELSSNGTLVNYKIDSGSQANILPYHQFKKLAKRPKLNQTKVSLLAYNSTDIPIKGSCIVNIKHNNRNIPALFIVADINSPPILGLKTSSNLKRIKRINMVDKMKKGVKNIPEYLKEYGECFGDLGCFPKTHHIVTDILVKPTKRPTQSVPISMQTKLYEELQCMIKIGVIVTVEEPTEWVYSFVAVKKPDKSLRLCLDPCDSNKAVKRPDFRLPTTEEMITKIDTCKKFTKLDASCAYWQIPLDYESSLLTTFSTPFGRFRFIRMPYGITSASDVCQQYIYEILEGIEGAANSQDDILIWANDNNQLKQKTIQVFDAILASGMKLNPAKCLFHLTELVFLDHKITSNGILPDDYKIKAITEMVYPSTVKELQRFLRLINYVGKFLPDLSEKTEALRQLLLTDVKFLLDENHKKEIDELKQMITRAPVLKNFDPKLPTKISCDASSTGLGAVLEQQDGENWFPIAYSSCTLTSTENNYCQLEKETLSILFACNKFHDYVYGRKFYVYNDHLPLKSIFNKNITKAPARIQRFMLRLQRYDFDLHYIKGSKLTVADALSRSSLKENVPEISEHEMSLYVHSILTTDFISENLLRVATQIWKSNSRSFPGVFQEFSRRF